MQVAFVRSIQSAGRFILQPRTGLAQGRRGW